MYSLCQKNVALGWGEGGEGGCSVSVGVSF